LVTGLSGAGKSSILHVLEDLGYETVDNPPLAILETLVGDDHAPLAAGVDARSRGFDAEQALVAVRRLRERPGLSLTIVFAAAEEAILLRRYTETRRRHPMAPGGPAGTRVQDGIARETALLAPLREAADLVVDTSDLPLPELRRLIEARFRLRDGPGLNVLIQSFAYPRGLPREADLVFDMRFLRNPHYDPALRPHTGQDANVGRFIEADDAFPGFWAGLTGFLDPLLPRYVAEGKKYLTITFGCSGGRHRSVYVAERLADRLNRQGWRVDLAHRELGGIRAMERSDVRTPRRADAGMAQLSADTPANGDPSSSAPLSLKDPVSTAPVTPFPPADPT
jgi:UPF0042 nucleotide-binding protein